MRGIVLLCFLVPNVVFARSASAEPIEWDGEALIANELKLVTDELARLGENNEERSREIGAMREELASTVERLRQILTSVVGRFEAFGQESDANTREILSLRGDLLSANERIAELHKLIVDEQAERVELPAAAVDADFSAKLKVFRDRSTTNVLIKQNQGLKIEFPARIIGGYKSAGSPLVFERSEQNLIVFLKSELDANGEVILVGLEGGRFVAVRILQATQGQVPDVLVRIAEE